MPCGCVTPAVKDLINQTLGPDDVHVLKWRFYHRRECHLDAVLLVEAAFDAVVHESNQPGCNDSANQLAVRHPSHGW